MPRHDAKLFESQEPPAGLRVPHLTGSRSALDALSALRRSQGGQVIVLGPVCARVSVAHVRARSGYAPHRGEIRIGTLAHCPIYATRSCIETCPHERLILDVVLATGRRGAPVFLTRPESRMERQERVFSSRAWGG
jgi:uncharacterized protein (DUF779 family)